MASLMRGITTDLKLTGNQQVKCRGEALEADVSWHERYGSLSAATADGDEGDQAVLRNWPGRPDAADARGGHGPDGRRTGSVSPGVDRRLRHESDSHRCCNGSPMV